MMLFLFALSLIPLDLHAIRDSLATGARDGNSLL